MPGGSFGTFNLVAAHPEAEHLQFAFHSPRIFTGVDISNDSGKPATISIHAQGQNDVSVTVQPGQLRRVRTGWREPDTDIGLDLKNGAGLKFDNLAYRLP